MKKEHSVNLECSFCEKSQREVRKLIAGPASYSCDECIGLCNDIIAEEIQLESDAAAVRSALAVDGRALVAAILERGSGAMGSSGKSLTDGASRSSSLRLRMLLWRFRKGPSRQIQMLWSLGSLESEWMMLRRIVGTEEARPEASSSCAEVELPEWVRHAVGRITASAEVLEILAATPGRVRLEGSLESLDLALAQLRHARDLLLAGPPRQPVD